jgi:hypothetical protein
MVWACSLSKTTDSLSTDSKRWEESIDLCPVVGGGARRKRKRIMNYDFILCLTGPPGSSEAGLNMDAYKYSILPLRFLIHVACYIIGSQQKILALENRAIGTERSGLFVPFD